MATTFSFENSIEYLQNIGVFDYVLPFLLIFAIVFAALEKTKILGTDKTNINAVVSLVIGLLLISRQEIVAIINEFLPNISLILVVILMSLLLISVIAGDEFKGLNNGLLTMGIIVVITAVVIALANPVGYGSFSLTQREIVSLLQIAVPVGALLLIILFVVGGRRKGDADKKKLGDIIGDIFGRGGLNT